VLGHRRLLDNAALLHTLNADEARLIEPLRLRCRVEIIPNGVFLEEVHPMPSRGSFYRKHGKLAGRPFILFLGRLHYKKGLDFLADAFISIAASRRELMLVIAGPDAGARAQFEAQIAAAGLMDRVLMAGPLYGRDKLEALADAACFCLPSRQEGFSMAIVEALACGVPAVISADCHFQAVGEAGAGEVVELRPEAIAAALLRVTSNEDERRRMGIRGSYLVQSHYSWPKIAKQTVAAYRKAGAIDSSLAARELVQV
jgi:glycosyltransferase involved in cell wall biosynthesis